ncbi:hypothetical protein C0583_06650 [Candidatus Parcubacteria bacterium]|nr:MAG: hypothetical protein C0583_06650 [Candidatus Parcubacteria bacterium]
MKKVLIFIFIFFALPVLAQDMGERLAGRILLQVEDEGQAWYVEPSTKERIFLSRPQDAFRIMRELGLGVNEKDFSSWKMIAPASLSGRIVLRVEASGEAYYINPLDLHLHYLGKPVDAFQVMRDLGLGIRTSDLSEIVMNSSYQVSEERIIDNDKQKLYLFYGSGCPHCHNEIAFLDELVLARDDIEVVMMETWYDEANRDILEKFKEVYGIEIRGVPFTVIGGETITGFGTADTTGVKIIDLLESQKGAKDIVEPVIENRMYYVDYVVDGDTFLVYENGKKTSVRVIGMDTPEVMSSYRAEECFGEEASEYAKTILEGTYVELEFDETQGNLDKYDRLLRHVIMPNGKNFAELMIEEGYANEYTYNVASKYAGIYKLAEARAKENKKGIWADGACLEFGGMNSLVKASSSSELEIVNIFYDGVASDKEEDEYIEIQNNGEALSMDDYEIRDGSGKSYVFDDFGIASGESFKVFTGCGEDTSQELYWCHTYSAIWNNSGDEAYLLNPSDEIIATYTY